MIKAVIWIPLFKYNPDSITWMAYAQQQAQISRSTGYP